MGLTLAGMSSRKFSEVGQVNGVAGSADCALLRVFRMESHQI